MDRPLPEMINWAPLKGEPMGFPVQDDTYTTFIFNNATKTLTLSPVGAFFNVWVGGHMYRYTVAQAVDISLSIVEGLWYFYFSAAGVLSASQTPWNLATQAPVAMIYWDATSTVAIVLVDYRNGVVMSWASQQRTEQANGTTYSSGLDLTGPVTGDGSADVDAEVAITNGILALGDIQIDVTDGAAGRFRQDLAPIAQLPVYSLDGAGPVWRKTAATNFPTLQGVNRVKYNLNTGGTWTQPEATVDGNYVAMWVFGVNDYDNPIFCVLGQRQDTTLADAQKYNVYDDLTLAPTLVPNARLLYRLIFVTDSTYANVPKAALREIKDFRTEKPWLFLDDPADGFVNLSPYVVGPVGIAPYQSVQTAVTAAELAGVDTSVYIYPGTYTGNVALIGTPIVRLVGLHVMGQVADTAADPWPVKIIGSITVDAAGVDGTMVAQDIWFQKTNGNLVVSAGGGYVVATFRRCGFYGGGADMFNLVGEIDLYLHDHCYLQMAAGNSAFKIIDDSACYVYLSMNDGFMFHADYATPATALAFVDSFFELMNSSITGDITIGGAVDMRLNGLALVTGGNGIVMSAAPGAGSYVRGIRGIGVAPVVTGANAADLKEDPLATIDQILVYNGSKWVPGDPAVNTAIGPDGDVAPTDAAMIGGKVSSSIPVELADGKLAALFIDTFRRLVLRGSNLDGYSLFVNDPNPALMRKYGPHAFAALAAPGVTLEFNVENWTNIIIAVTLASINTDLVVQAEGSLDDAVWFPCPVYDNSIAGWAISGAQGTATADDTYALCLKPMAMNWVRLNFVSESGGTDATVAGVAMCGVGG